jgi:hypothetical protein
MNTKALLDYMDKFLALAENERQTDKPTLPIPSTSNAEIAGVPSSRPQSEVHSLKRENRDLRLYLSMLLNDPYISQYPIGDIKRIVEKKLGSPRVPRPR